MSFDERMDSFRFIKGAGVAATVPYFYPRMVAVHSLPVDPLDGPGGDVYPPVDYVRMSVERMDPNGAYLMGASPSARAVAPPSRRHAADVVRRLKRARPCPPSLHRQWPVDDLVGQPERWRRVLSRPVWDAVHRKFRPQHGTSVRSLSAAAARQRRRLTRTRVNRGRGRNRTDGAARAGHASVSARPQAHHTIP